MEDDLNFLQNERRPQFFNKMEDNLNFVIKWKITSIFCQTERRPQFSTKWKMAFFLSSNFLQNGGQPEIFEISFFSVKWKTTSISLTTWKTS